MCGREVCADRRETRTAKQDVKRTLSKPRVLEKEVVLMMCQAILFPIRKGNRGVQVHISRHLANHNISVTIQTCSV